MSKKSIIISIIVLIIVVGVGYLFAKKSGYVSDNTQAILFSLTQNELMKYKLVNGTPEEKETILTDFMSKLQKFRVATIPKQEQTDISAITSFLPSIIEAILDSTPLPQHEDTGWGNVYHFAATIMNKFAYKIDGVQREQDSKFGFWSSVGTANETARKTVHDNWLAWWNDNKDKMQLTSSVKVITPNGGETLRQRSSYIITWSGISATNSWANIYIEGYCPPNAVCKMARTSLVVSGAHGSYNWNVGEVLDVDSSSTPVGCVGGDTGKVGCVYPNPTKFLSPSLYYIRVCDGNMNTPESEEACDRSDAPFRIF